MKIIDCDLHVIEPPDLWRSMGLEGHGWVGLRKTDGSSVGIPDEYTHPPDPFHYNRGLASALRDGFNNNWDPASTLRAMDREGIEQAIIIPTRGLLVLCIYWNDMPSLDEACKIYNEWASDYCMYGEGRLKMATLIPTPWFHSEVLNDYDMAAAFVTRPNCMAHGDWVWTSPKPLILHEGTVPIIDTIGDNHCPNRLTHHITSHVYEAMNAVMHLTVGGVLFNNPLLKVLLCETGSWWLPGWLTRLDNEAMGINGWQHYRLPRRPSFYAKQIYIVEEPGHTSHYPRRVFGSDYPHGDSEFPHAVVSTAIEDLQAMTTNAEEFLNVEVPSE